MRIVVAGIPRPGLEVIVDPAKDWVRDAATVALDAEPSSVGGQLDIQARGKKVEVRGDVNASAPATCDRCGTDFERSVQTELALAYLPEGRGAFEAELELGADDLDVGWYRDGELDLGDVLREALALALPSRTICSDTAGCDARTEALLESDAEEPVHPAFAALADLK